MATRLELEQEAGRRAAAKRQVIAMGAAPAPAVIVSDAPMPTDEVVEELVRQAAPKRSRNRKPKAEEAVEDAPPVEEAVVEQAPDADLDDIDALLDL
jgi:hypothetical protein